MQQPTARRQLDALLTQGTPPAHTAAFHVLASALTPASRIWSRSAAYRNLNCTPTRDDRTISDQRKTGIAYDVLIGVLPGLVSSPGVLSALRTGESPRGSRDEMRLIEQRTTRLLATWGLTPRDPADSTQITVEMLEAISQALDTAA